MIKVIHKPVKGARYTYPTVAIGEVREVSQADAAALIATGAWQAVDQKREPEKPAEEAAKPAGGKR